MYIEERKIVSHFKLFILLRLSWEDQIYFTLHINKTLDEQNAHKIVFHQNF